MNTDKRPDLSLFLATSGHSGVDRVMKNLLPHFAAKGLRIDLLTVRNHGPYWPSLPDHVRQIDLGRAHVYSSLLPLRRYLCQQRPRTLLCDKDKLNHTALIARLLSRLAPPDRPRIAVRVGTTVSENLKRRSAFARKLQYSSIRYLYRYADAIIVPSAGVAADLSQLGRLPVAAISVINNPVIDADFDRRAQQPLEHPWFGPNQPPVVLGVGELSARKDFTTLIKAFARLRQQRRCRLLILGKGRQREHLLALAQTLQLGADDVQLPGFVDNPLPFMAKAAVFALTSICEGSAVVLIEALAVGTAIVSTDCRSGPRETLANGHYGELVPVADTQALARALQHSLDAPKPATLLRQAAAAFTVERSAQQYLNTLGLFSTPVLSTRGLD